MRVKLSQHAKRPDWGSSEGRTGEQRNKEGLFPAPVIGPGT